MTALEILALKQIHESLKLHGPYKETSLDIQDGRENEIYQEAHATGFACGMGTAAKQIQELIKAAEEDAKRK